MSEETTTTPTVTAPAVDTTTKALADLQRDNASLLTEVTQHKATLATAIRERDELRGHVAQLKPRAELADALQIQVNNATNEKREAAIIEHARGKAPDAEPIALRGVLAQLHDAGKVNRHAEDPVAEGEKFLKALEAEAPSLLRPRTAGGGSAGARAANPEITTKKNSTNAHLL